MQPLLSIVIANYNYGRFLEDAIQSIIAQDMGGQVELIICDASSTDNSVDIIKKYSNGLPPNTPYEEWSLQPLNRQTTKPSNQLLTWWCSEKDGGQSAAFNKGFSHARGKYLTWLNADDLLVPGALEKVLCVINQYPECQWFTGNSFRFLEDGSVMEIIWGPHRYPSFLQHQNSPIVVFGPTSFFTQKIYREVGMIDEKLHYAMDNDLWLRFMNAGIKQQRINCLIWAFRMHDSSKTAEFGMHQMDEISHLRMQEEGRISAEKVGYRMSRWLHFAVRLWRVLDGSMLYRMYLRLTFRKFRISNNEKRSVL